MTSKKFWRHGEKSQLAKATGLKGSQIYDILARNKNVSPDRAALLEKKSIEIFGIERRIPKEDWAFNMTTYHPAFSKREVSA